MKNNILLLLLLSTIFFIANVSAISPSSPTNISLSCGDYNYLSITGISTDVSNITNTKWIKPGLNVGMGFDFKNLLSGGNTLTAYFFTNTENCQPGSTSTTFNIGDEDYTINIEILKEEYKLGEKLLSVNEVLKIGKDISFGLLGIGDNYIHYVLKGCTGIIEEDTTTEEISKTCNGNVDIKIRVITTIPELDVVKFEVFSSEPSFILTKSNETTEECTDCVLGLDTLGAKVKRGNIFAIKTINANTGKYVPQVAVTIMDMQGELPPIAGTSNNIGFFSERLYEDYKQDLIVSLEKDGCEPSTQVIMFEKSYDDYKKAKEEEQEAYKLVLNISGKYEINKEISYKVNNALGDAVEGVKVKITKPDSSSFEVITDSEGIFKFTPDQVGTYKLQAGKDGYESSDLSEIEIFRKEEYKVVTIVNGEIKSEYKKGDRITFELRDKNNTLLPITIDATFNGQPLRFINGVSDTITFEGSSTLVIPATEGYNEQRVFINEKRIESSTLFYIGGIIIGIIIVLILVFAVVKKSGRMGKISRIPDALKEADIKLG